MKPSNTNQEISQADQWREWAIAAQGGDKRAYAALLRDIAPFIKNSIIGTLANSDWADDITQEVLLSVHKSLKTYSPDRPFKPWLGAIVNFRKTDFLRKHYSARGDKKTSLDNAEFMASHVTNSPHAGELKDIEGALDALPAKQRKVFQMMKIEGYSAKEIANQMGMSVTAVKVSAHRTMNKLKDKLG